MSDRPNMGGLSRKHIQQACEDSLRRLGVDTIDLYQIHRLDPETPMEEMLAALDHLVTQGKVRYIGASSMYAWQFQRLLSLSEQNGWARFVSMQNHYNLIYREEEREMLPLCEDQGVAVIPWSPLARGMLAGTRSKLGDSSTSRSSSDGLDQILYDQPSDWEVVEAVKSVAADRGEPAGASRTGLAHVEARRDRSNRRRHQATTPGRRHCCGRARAQRRGNRGSRGAVQGPPGQGAGGAQELKPLAILELRSETSDHQSLVEPRRKAR